MNLIGNTCCATVVTTKFMKQQISNVFFYNVLDFNSAKNLVMHYDNIDFKKVSFELRGGFCYAVVDNLVTIFYPHYLYGENRECIKEGDDLKSSSILEICKDNYFKRLERMVEPPTFLFASRHQPFLRESADYAPSELLELLNSKTEYPICIASEYELDFKNSPTREFIHISEPVLSNGVQLARFVMNHSILLNKNNRQQLPAK